MKGETEMNRIFYESMMEECAHTMQGFYGRFWYGSYLPADDARKDAFCNELREKKVASILDFVMFMES